MGKKNSKELANLLEKLTSYFNTSRKGNNVLPSSAIQFLKNQLDESSYVAIEEKFLMLTADQTFAIEFLTNRQTPNKIWLENGVSKADESRELFFMNWVVTPALWKLRVKNPEIAEDPNVLTSEDYQSTTKQLRNKAPKHLEDFFPFIKFEFSVKKSDLSTENVEGCEIVTLINSKLKTFIDDPNFVKIVGTTVKSLQVNEKKVPWYIPVIHCYHVPTRFNIMIVIPSLEFLSCFALDDEQYQLFMDYHFVPFRQSEDREIDRLLELISDGDNSIQGYFPESFLSNPKVGKDDIVSLLSKARFKNQKKKDL